MANTVYSYYCLDILHIGHIIHLKKSKEVAGENGTSIVGILTDEAIMEKKPKPITSFKERFEIATSLKFVDKVVSQKTYSPLDNIKLFKPNILMESNSHSQESIKELTNYIENIGGRVIITSYYERQSSTKIRDLIKSRK